MFTISSEYFLSRLLLWLWLQRGQNQFLKLYRNTSFFLNSWLLNNSFKFWARFYSDQIQYISDTLHKSFASSFNKMHLYQKLVSFNILSRSCSFNALAILRQDGFSDRGTEYNLELRIPNKVFKEIYIASLSSIFEK